MTPVPQKALGVLHDRGMTECVGLVVTFDFHESVVRLWSLKMCITAV